MTKPVDTEQDFGPTPLKRPADAAQSRPQNPEVVDRSRKTEPPEPIEIAEEIKDRILP